MRDKIYANSRYGATPCEQFLFGNGKIKDLYSLDDKGIHIDTEKI